MEEGGLNLSLLFQPITAYVSNKREMLEQCFHVLGEKKLHKMLPEELKVIYQLILSVCFFCFFMKLKWHCIPFAFVKIKKTNYKHN